MTIAAHCPLCHTRVDAQLVVVANVDGRLRDLVQCPDCRLVWALEDSDRPTRRRA